MRNGHSLKVFELWLNDNEIIWDTGVECESERIDQGRSYVDKNIKNFLYFFSRFSQYNGNGFVTSKSHNDMSNKLLCSFWLFCSADCNMV